MPEITMDPYPCCVHCPPVCPTPDDHSVMCDHGCDDMDDDYA